MTDENLERITVARELKMHAIGAEAFDRGTISISWTPKVAHAVADVLAQHDNVVRLRSDAVARIERLQRLEADLRAEWRAERNWRLVFLVFGFALGGDLKAVFHALAALIAGVLP